MNATDSFQYTPIEDTETRIPVTLVQGENFNAVSNLHICYIDMALSRPLTLGEKVLSAQVNISSSGVLTMHTIEIGTGLASSCMGPVYPTSRPVPRFSDTCPLLDIDSLVSGSTKWGRDSMNRVRTPL